MIIEDLIRKAVERLNKVKRLNLNIDDITITGLPDKDNVFIVSITDGENVCSFNVIIDEDLYGPQLLPDDPANLSPDDIIMLRIAKHIFETYKNFKANLANDSLTLNGDQTICSLKIGSATYDIGVNGRNLAATFDELDDLKDKVEELKIEKQDLENQLKSLQSTVDLLLGKCQDKGII